MFRDASDNSKEIKNEVSNIPKEIVDSDGAIRLPKEIGLENGFEKKEIAQCTQNKMEGLRREGEVSKELEVKYPSEEGYTVLKERVLCDRNGNPVRDGNTGQMRRVDFAVVKEGKVVSMIEVTSKTAPKNDQLAKEYRIRSDGGNYIKDTVGNIYRIPNNVETRVERRY